MIQGDLKSVQVSAVIREKMCYTESMVQNPLRETAEFQEEA